MWSEASSSRALTSTDLIISQQWVWGKSVPWNDLRHVFNMIRTDNLIDNLSDSTEKWYLSRASEVKAGGIYTPDVLDGEWSFVHLLLWSWWFKTVLSTIEWKHPSYLNVTTPISSSLVHCSPKVFWQHWKDRKTPTLGKVPEPVPLFSGHSRFQS